MDNWKEILEQFNTVGTLCEPKVLGNGLINDTFIVRTAEPECDDYVLQRINNAIFPDVELLQRNIEIVTDHIRAKLHARGEKDIKRKALQFIKTRDRSCGCCNSLSGAEGGNLPGAKTYVCVDGKYWRLSVFIEDSKSYEAVTPEFAYLTGKSFGDFEGMLSDIPAGKVGASIVNFHNLKFRLGELDAAIAADTAGRVREMKPVIDKVLAAADKMCVAQNEQEAGKLPTRLAHCDTKVNNMLFDAKDDNFLCVIDLDTVMPSTVLSDFGDFIRTAGNCGAEDDKDLSNVHLNMPVFQSFAKGYLEGTKDFLTLREKELLPFGGAMMTYMQTVRFLADYLNGDTYYKIKYPRHNYDRTMAQLTLFEDIEKHLQEMNNYIQSI
ncbi:MAG: phosphotransferase [Bacteroidales bacterium]|nr:phosphotransferase [Bacteroidales bacterium]MDD4421285.1 phosphotransferase [Bacteroidales bacterium]